MVDDTYTKLVNPKRPQSQYLFKKNKQSLLGKGIFGEVYKGFALETTKSVVQVAIKVIPFKMLSM